MNFEPIGVIHSRFVQATGTPIQPSRAIGSEGSVELLPDYVEGLEDLAGFERIWLIYWLSAKLADGYADSTIGCGREGW